MPDAYICRRLRQYKISRKASDAADVVRFFHPRLSCTTTHISADVQRITLHASCMTISGERTEQLDIFCHITGFTRLSQFHRCGTYSLLSRSPSIVRILRDKLPWWRFAVSSASSLFIYI